MAEASIPVDLFNPGQVFACLGFVETAIALLGEAEGAFDWREPITRFWLRAPGDVSPVLRVLEFLDRASARAVAPNGSPSSAEWRDSWGERPISVEPGEGYPFPDPGKPAMLVCRLSDGTHAVHIDHWGDRAGRDSVKFWAGAGGYPGAALARDALALVKGHAAEATKDPFNFGRLQSSSFRFDWRRDYIPIESGFSLNEHGGRIRTLGYPLVELLAAIGLSHARPKRPDPRNKLVYTYAVIGRDETSPDAWISAPMLRASLGGPSLPFVTRRFRMFLANPGKDDRAITTVTEET